MTEIVIVGCGCSGLFTAYLLCQLGLGKKISIVSKHFPGDMSIDYPSPIAGANFAGLFAGVDQKMMSVLGPSYKKLAEFTEKYGNNPEAGIARCPQIDLFDKLPSATMLDLLKAYVEDYEEITDRDYLASRGAVFGHRYRGFQINTPVALKFLKKMVEEKGVTFEHRQILDLKEVIRPETRVVFNCAGLLASRIGSVKDSHANYPVRGQVVIVRAPHVKQCMNLDIAGEEPTYIIPRPFSNGRVILGGFYQKGETTSDTSAVSTKDILERTIKLLPELTANGPIEVLDERSGLRPGRDGGNRLERTYVSNVPVIHNYGAGGVGWMAGLEHATRAISLFLPSDGRVAKL